MFVAIAFLGLKHLKRVRNTDGGLLCDFIVDAVFQAQDRSMRTGFSAKDLPGMVEDRWMIALWVVKEVNRWSFIGSL
jgi:hypothetical protein